MKTLRLFFVAILLMQSIFSLQAQSTAGKTCEAVSRCF